LAIKFFSENSFKLKKKRDTSTWIKQVIQFHQKSPGEISFIFCTDDQLLEINQTYLKHFYYTDVITFNYNDGIVISGDIYISTDRIVENAKNYKVSFENELYRVMVHGILHLLGFEDKDLLAREKMHELENFHLIKIGF